jgi:hypothetical protein
LAVGEAERVVSGQLKPLIAEAVTLERLASAVGAEGVGFDGEPPGAPEEVDLDGRPVVDDELGVNSGEVDGLPRTAPGSPP